MHTKDDVLDVVRDWIALSNPGLVTRADLSQLEARLDELNELLKEIEAQIRKRAVAAD